MGASIFSGLATNSNRHWTFQKRLKEGIVQTASGDDPANTEAAAPSRKKKGRGVTSPEKIAEAERALTTTPNEEVYSKHFNLATLQAVCENHGLPPYGDRIDMARILVGSVSTSSKHAAAWLTSWLSAPRPLILGAQCGTRLRALASFALRRSAIHSRVPLAAALIVYVRKAPEGEFASRRPTTRPHTAGRAVCIYVRVGCLRKLTLLYSGSGRSRR